MCRHSSLHICYWSQSMTNVHCQWVWFTPSERIFVIDHSQWQICLNTECDSDSVACIFVIDRSQWQMCMDSEFDLDSVSEYLSLTTVNNKYAWTLSLIQTQWVHICHWPKSMTNVHGQWVWFRLSECIFVIDHSQWQMCIETECDLNSLSFIFVIDHS